MGAAGFPQLGDEIGPSIFWMNLLSINGLQKRRNFFSQVDVQQTQEPSNATPLGLRVSEWACRQLVCPTAAPETVISPSYREKEGNILHF